MKINAVFVHYPSLLQEFMWPTQDSLLQFVPHNNNPVK